jgi:YtkA-like
MRSITRLTTAAMAVAAALALSATAAFAGSSAEVSIISGGETPPTAGEERELRLSVLQHGVTPVEAGRVTITAELPGSTETISVPATHVGGGEWVATVTFPTGGDWQLRVTHNVFETPAPSTFAVAPSPAIGWLPAGIAIGAALLAAAGLVLVARAFGRDRPSRTEAMEPARTG